MVGLTLWVYLSSDISLLFSELFELMMKILNDLPREVDV